MKLWLPIAVVYSGVTTVSPPSPESGLIYVLVALISGGGMTLLWQMWLRRRRGALDDDSLATKVSAEVMEAAKGLMDEYRIQLEVARRQIDQYLEQMAELNRLLGEANARIGALESRLEGSEGERQGLRRELDEAIARRDSLLREMREMKDRIAELERKRYGD